MALRLDSVRSIPEPILRELGMHRSDFKESEFVEQILENADLYSIAQGLDTLCLREGVIGYHFTRAFPEAINRAGLKISQGADRRAEFMSLYASRFSEAQRSRIRNAWKNYFDRDPLQITARDNRVWFNFTLQALSNGGADALLTFFGGENIYMPLAKDDEIAEILKCIGQPLVVAAKLSAKSLHTFSQIPWGTILLSSYHVTVNEAAYQHDVDAYLRESVPPRHLTAMVKAQSTNHRSWSVKPGWLS
jgi:hypothetical protein